MQASPGETVPASPLPHPRRETPQERTSLLGMLAAVLPKPGAGLGKQQAPQEILAE